MEACLKKEIEVQEKVKTLESELKDLEQLYNEDEINKLSSHNLHSKITKIVEEIKVMKSYEKTCFEFPQKVCDDEIAYIFRKLQHWTFLTEGCLHVDGSHPLQFMQSYNVTLMYQTTEIFLSGIWTT